MGFNGLTRLFFIESERKLSSLRFGRHFTFVLLFCHWNFIISLKNYTIISKLYRQRRPIILTLDAVVKFANENNVISTFALFLAVLR